MFAKVFGHTVAFLLLMESGYSTPAADSVKSFRYEEYFVEHEVSALQAKNVALATDSQSIVTPPGCQKCTPDEMKYCTGRDLINDHCCCDKRYFEALPYIPHTCYLGKQLCSPVIGDCAKYSRLRTCCCDKYVFEKWKRKYMHSGQNYTSTSSRSFTLIMLIEALFIFVHNIIV
ncbi:hypothetical protein NQ317_001859 [Molorchus minor]|uniref:CCC domain-containing protein n=1 Tax=Molorchus minor TaxID=1323400 RepID=A0ABQ9JYP6_9CUCU|nr:hypothetical protein NQ317_001859 [Molorchus minor]